MNDSLTASGRRGDAVARRLEQRRVRHLDQARPVEAVEARAQRPAIGAELPSSIQSPSAMSAGNRNGPSIRSALSQVGPKKAKGRVGAAPPPPPGRISRAGNRKPGAPASDSAP
jgi:hypothetical protein